MPDIDVSDLLFDSDIAGEALSVIRREEMVGTNGVSTITNMTLPAEGDDPIVGSVFPTGDNSLVAMGGLGGVNIPATFVGYDDGQSIRTVSGSRLTAHQWYFMALSIGVWFPLAS